jgi:hypothetical protein
VRGVWGVFVPYFCVVCEGGRRIEVGRQAGRRCQVEKRKRKKKKGIQQGPVLCRLVLSCPIRFMPYPLVFDWHKNAWSFGTFFFFFPLSSTTSECFFLVSGFCLFACFEACVCLESQRARQIALRAAGFRSSAWLCGVRERASERARNGMA